jgi:hypothetical protein
MEKYAAVYIGIRSDIGEVPERALIRRAQKDGFTVLESNIYVEEQSAFKENQTVLDKMVADLRGSKAIKMIYVEDAATFSPKKSPIKGFS